MSNDTIISCSDPTFHDELTALVRGGARRMLCEALIADVETFCAQYAGETDDQGRRAVVRNGYLPEREILTGIGPVAVRVPQTRDRAGEGRCLRSELLPPDLKKTRRLAAVIPWLYLNGVATNDFDAALTAVFGQSVKGLSATTISRLKQGWEHQYADFRRRDWHGHECV